MWRLAGLQTQDHAGVPWSRMRQQHTVNVERVTDAVPGLAYSILINAVGRCPPEDVGGP